MEGRRRGRLGGLHEDRFGGSGRGVEDESKG